mgnify:CR=1|nr:MAG TPA: hypothetical protein [Crassvirales sp.]
MTTYQFHVFLSLIGIVICLLYLMFNYLSYKKVFIVRSLVQTIITYIIVISFIRLLYRTILL